MRAHIGKVKAALVILALFSACSLKQSGAPSGTPTRPSAAASITIAPMNFRQVLGSMTNVTGTSVDGNLNTAFTELKPGLPAVGLSTEVTSVLSAVNIAGRICFNFVTNEQNIPVGAARKAFKTFDFSDTSSLKSDNVKNSAQNLAQMFMGRTLVDSELNYAVNASNSTLSGNTGGQPVFDVALVLCTGIATSAESLNSD